MLSSPQNPSNFPLLQVENLSIDFVNEETKTMAVEDISFTLHKGETIALVGESGSGKSVTALSILRLLPSPPAYIRKGQLFFSADGMAREDILTLSNVELEKIRGHKIGFIFQEPMSSLNPLMKCGLQVQESILLHLSLSKKDAYHKVVQLFEEVKLPTPEIMFDRYPHELSGGQKQRVMIAMAIACDPVLLIADEPTTALDVTVQKSIVNLLKELQQKKGMGILFITHDLKLVSTFADYVMVLRKGKLIESNTIQQIFQHPQEKYTKGLLTCRPSIATRVKQLVTIEQFEKEEKSSPSNVISYHDYVNHIEHLSNNKKILEAIQMEVWYPVRRSFWGKVNSWSKAVQGVDFTLHESETIGLVGESGCGKTSIGRALVGLASIQKGDLLYYGKSMRDFTKADWAIYRKNVQIIFQDPYSSLNPRISIGDAIKEPMDVYGLHPSAQRKEKVKEFLTKVGLHPDVYNRYPHEFSGGQRQRICIARVLALEPTCIICDESVSALDVSVQAQILNLLTALRDEFKLSYLFISHDISVVKHISDSIAVMHQGKIIEFDHAEAMYHSPKETFSKQLIAAAV